MGRCLAALILAGAVAPLLGPVAPASAAVPGYELVDAASAYDSSWTKTVTATCPAEKKLIGMGAKTWLPHLADLTISMIAPDAALTAVTVKAHRKDNGAANPFLYQWDVRAFAVCASPVPGLEMVEGPPPPVYDVWSPSSRTANVSCPTGKKALGVGGRITSNGTAVAFSGIRPKDDLSGAVVRAHEMGPYSAQWQLKAYAICANPLPGLELVQASVTNPGPATFAQSELLCPGSKVAVGGGTSVSDLLGKAKVVAQGPSTYLSSGADAYGAAVEQVPTNAAWTLTVYGICVTQ